MGRSGPEPQGQTQPMLMTSPGCKDGLKTGLRRIHVSDYFLAPLTALNGSENHCVRGDKKGGEQSPEHPPKNRCPEMPLVRRDPPRSLEGRSVVSLLSVPEITDVTGPLRMRSSLWPSEQAFSRASSINHETQNTLKMPRGLSTSGAACRSQSSGSQTSGS